MAEERVTLEDTVAVLAKHAKISGAPDDEAVLARYLEQEQEAQQEAAPKAPAGKKGQ